MHETEKEETIEGNLLNGCAECSGQLLGIGIGDWGLGHCGASQRIRKKSMHKGREHKNAEYGAIL